MSPAVSQSTFQQLALLEQYAAAAYCPSNNQPNSNTTITCTAGNCPQVQTTGATTLLEFQNEGAADATGYVAVDHVSNLIVIAFRGSESVVNWLGNVNIAMAPWSFCAGCTVHAGFYDSWNSVKPQVESTLTTATQTWPSYSVVATGHSLGGAMAALAAAELRTIGVQVTLYTYGQPMSGNMKWAQFVTNQGNNFRVTHQKDVVPTLPGLILGYHPSEGEYHITSGDNKPVTTSDINLSTGLLQGDAFGTSVSNHGWYFNAISACSPDTLDA